MTAQLVSSVDTLPTMPGVEFKQSADACRIHADITGFYANEVSVKATKRTVVVELTNTHQPCKSYYLGEVEAERHVRAIPLDFDIDTQSIRTYRNNGKLEILVLKADRLEHVQREATAA